MARRVATGRGAGLVNMARTCPSGASQDTAVLPTSPALSDRSGVNTLSHTLTGDPVMQNKGMTAESNSLLHNMNSEHS